MTCASQILDGCVNLLIMVSYLDFRSLLPWDVTQHVENVGHVFIHDYAKHSWALGRMRPVLLGTFRTVLEQ